MIKKEYIQPEVKEVKVILPTILAGSGETPDVDTTSEESDWTDMEDVG
jgi:hypothetical protein